MLYGICVHTIYIYSMKFISLMSVHVAVDADVKMDVHMQKVHHHVCIRLQDMVW